MDRLTPLLRQCTLHGSMTRAGVVRDVLTVDPGPAQASMHLVARGVLLLEGIPDPGASPVRIASPALVFLPRPPAHRLVVEGDSEAELLSMAVRLGDSRHNPIADSLPAVVQVDLAALPGAPALAALLMEEARAGLGGGEAILERLTEVLVVQLLRHCIRQGLTTGGTLAGLADRRLSRAVSAMLEQPGNTWDLGTLAALAGMSRARFAVRFREVTGHTPADCLTGWRLLTAQRLLVRGEPLKLVAQAVGYGSASALARVFQRRLGCSPMSWLDSGPPLSGR